MIDLQNRKNKISKIQIFCRQVIPAGSFCNSNEPKSGLARDLGNCLQSRNVPLALPVIVNYDRNSVIEKR